MSYEASAHKTQMKILKHLLLTNTSSFAELQKDSNLTSDHFNFHIKKLVAEGYVQKHNNIYSLTRVGKEYANRMDTDENIIEKQPKISVLLVIQNNQGKLLHQERLKQPYYGFWGFPTGKVRWGETVIEAAARELLEETGLTADLAESGLVHKMDYDKESGEFLEDKYFLTVFGTNPKGVLIADTEGQHNEWLSANELSRKEKVFESIKEIASIAQAHDYKFFEKKYYYTPSDY